MKEKGNIEQLFKDTFENFEADVNPQVWSNVQSGMNSAAGSAASSAAKFALGKIIAGAAAVAVVAGSVWYFSTSDNKIATPEAATPTTQSGQTVASNQETTSPASSSDQLTTQYSTTTENATGGSPMPPAIRSLNHYGSDYSQQPQNASHPSTNGTVNDASASENTNAAQPEQHKYGNATVGTGNMLPNFKSSADNSKTSAKKKAAPVENQGTEQAAAVNIYASTESGDWPLTVNFSNLGVSSALSWDFGDGGSSRETAPEHKFDKPGIYVVKLVAQNSKGTNMDKVTIEVKPISEIQALDVYFTPDGDGNNDSFYFVQKNILSIDVSISSMEGLTVYKLTTVDGKWYGKLANGSAAPKGRYFYGGQAIGKDGVVYPLKGSIDLR